MVISSSTKIGVTLTILNSTYVDYTHMKASNKKENELQLCTTHEKADSSSTPQYISCHLHKTKFSYHVHKKLHMSLYDISITKTI